MRSTQPSFSNPLIETLEARRLLAAGTGLTGEYFNGNDFQSAVLTRTDPTVQFNLAHTPDTLITAPYSVRWTGQVEAGASQTYHFIIQSNGGIRLWVNDSLIIDNWSNTAQSTSRGSIALQAGHKYDIHLDYAANTGRNADVKLFWSTPHRPAQIIPQADLFPASVTLPSGPGLVGAYYEGIDFNTPVMSRIDPLIKYNFGSSVPDSVLQTHQPFSVAWTGQIVAAYSQTYTFSTISDDGVRLWVNGQLIINDWHDHPAKRDSGTIALQAGQLDDISLAYYQDHGVASVKLRWASPSQPLQVVPTSALMHGTPAGPSDPSAAANGDSAIDLTWNPVANAAGYIVQCSPDGSTNWTQIGTTGAAVTSFDDTSLDSGTTYCYRILAQVYSTLSSPSPTVQTSTAPAAPVDLVAAATGNDISLTWDAATGATSYIIYRSDDGSTLWSQVGTTTAPALSFAQTALPNGTTYYYRVIAAIDSTQSDPSNVASATTVPAAPTDLAAAVVSDTQISLTWDDVAAEEGFVIRQSPDGVTDWTNVTTLAPATTAYTVAALAPSSTYYFQIFAVNAAGTSAGSNIPNATTTGPAPSYAAETVVYGLDSGEVYSIDTTTGDTTDVGTMSFTTNAAGRDPVTGDFYYIEANSTSPRLAAWDPTTNSNTLLNAGLSVNGTIALAAFNDQGVFYCASASGSLYAIDRTTGDPTLLGQMMLDGSPLAANGGDIAFSPNSTLYMCTGGILYSVNVSTLQATDIGNTNIGNVQIAFGQNGILYGTNASDLYSISTTDAAATLIGPTLDFGDLASVPLYADLSVTQSAQLQTINSLPNCFYTISVPNAGPDATTGPITLTDTLPAGVTYINGSGNGWIFSLAGSTLTMTYSGSVASAASAPDVILQVALGQSAASPLVNALSVTTTIFDTNTANNTSTLDTPFTM